MRLALWVSPLAPFYRSGKGYARRKRAGAYASGARYYGSMSILEEAPPLPPFPVKAETVAWLRERLASGSQRIAPLIAEWCGGQRVQSKGGVVWEGGRDGAGGRWISELMEARAVLGVEACLVHLQETYWERRQV
jgi:hypothetical protein